MVLYIYSPTRLYVLISYAQGQLYVPVALLSTAMSLRESRLRESRVFSLFSVQLRSQVTLTISCPSLHSLVLINCFTIMVRVACKRNYISLFQVSGVKRSTDSEFMSPFRWVPRFHFLCTSLQTSPPTPLCVVIHNMRLVWNFKVSCNFQLCLLLLLWKTKLT
jgi:hypothetical protein